MPATRPPQPPPQPAPQPFMVFAEIRWFANAIENRALQAYFGNHERYHQIRECLKAAYKCLYMPVRTENWNAENPDCPWPECWTGECTPECPARPPVRELGAQQAE